MFRTAFALGLTLAVATTASAQRRDTRFGQSNDDWCADAGHNGDHASYCEVRESTIGAAGTIDIDAGRNGGISVRGWDRGDAQVRVRIVGYGATNADAQRIASQVRIDTVGGAKAEGPDSGRDEGWSVSFEVSVPRNALLK